MRLGAPARLALLLMFLLSSSGALASERLVMQPIGGMPTAAPSGVSAPPERFSGYFKLNHTVDAHMFFFLFEARTAPADAPVVLWMTGGPGCSSELAVFFENGPWHIEHNLTLSESKYGWDTAATMIFVDQPINTGFSYSSSEDDTCYDETCVSNDMLDFLTALFEARPHLADNDFYVTGESYAGHYVPAVAHRVYMASKSGEVKPINLQGLAIGNGLTEPAIQYGAYADFAAEHGLISDTVRDAINLFYPACRLALEVCGSTEWAPECLLAVTFCQATMFGPILALNPGINVYDYRKDCVGQLCYSEFEIIDKYINRPEVREKLGVGDRKWEACNMEVHEEMMGDWGRDYSTLLPPLLHGGVRALIYAGEKDIICNYLGNWRWVSALQWDGAAEFAKAAPQTWTVDGEAAGELVTAGPLSFLRVANAGHMVPMDQPRNALDMITRFIRNEPLKTAPGQGSKLRQGSSAARKFGASQES